MTTPRSASPKDPMPQAGAVRPSGAARDGGEKPRDVLLEIQRSIVRDLKREIYSTESLDPALRRYYAEYRASCDSYTGVASKAELVDRIVESDVVFVGDFHTLRQSPRAATRLLENVLAHPGFSKRHSGLVLGIEMVQARDQSALDAYQAGSLDDAEFLRRIDYGHTWGFNWTHYQPLLESARRHNVPVVALNHRFGRSGDRSRNHLAERDQAAAEILAQRLATHPGELALVLFGDLHVAEPHLPAALEARLTAAGTPRRRLVIFQNSATIYWQLARHGLEQIADVVRIAPDRYCILNTTPLAKYQSQRNWLNRTEELACDLHPGWCDLGEDSADLTDQIALFTRAIARFFGLPQPNLSDLTVYTAHDLDLLGRLGRRLLTPAELAEIQERIRAAESFFVDRSNLVVLSNLSLNHAAEAAMHYLHAGRAGTAAAPPGRGRRAADAFYFQVLRDALGFLGSKIINHKRLCDKDRDWAAVLDRPMPPRPDRAGRLRVRIAELFADHRVREAAAAPPHPGEAPRAAFRPHPGIARWPRPVRRGLARAIGTTLGDHLYTAVILGFLAPADVRAFLDRPCTRRGEAMGLVLELLARVRYITGFSASRADQL